MAKLLVLNGPNLNLLGIREPEHYGHTTLDQIANHLQQMAQDAGHSLDFYQTNAEHEMVEQIHQARLDEVAFILLNPAAFTHTSVAVRDALQGVAIPFIEVHLSNIHAREEFRKASYFSDIAQGVISGLGPIGYELAMRAALERLKD